ncbi:MAG: putative porin [Hymenobacteraceae bacterium]|nr:putative porin [Hymenobacteraceae bacterium]
MLYGPRTTLQLYERDVLEGRLQRQRVDTLIHNMQDERFWYNDTAYYQHLGNLGTASQPLLYRMPQEIGVRLGKRVFDRYAYNPNTLNYFDTRSPYSHIYYVQGQRGEQVFEGTYTRNITERWNAGVAYQILSANKQIGTAERRDGLIDNQSVKAYTHYRSKNDRYDLFFNYTFMKHEQIESGGIRPLPGDTRDSLSGYETEQVYLTQAANEESRNNFHLTHIYKLAGENLKLYHTADWYRQVNEFQDDAPSSAVNGGEAASFYPNFFYSRMRTEDRTAYRQLQNVIGVTGNSKVSFFKAFIKHRNAGIDYSVLETVHPDTADVRGRITEGATYNQLFVGGQLRLFYQNKAELFLDGEFQLTRDYRVRAQGFLWGLQLSQERVLRSPSLVEEFMLSNHFRWDNDFQNTVTDRTEVSFARKLGERQHLKLGVNFTNINRYIYFNEQALPEQVSGSQRLIGAELAHHIRFGPVHFENFIAYTNTDEADKVRVPEWVFDSKLFLQGKVFGNALYGQFGVQAYMPTGYFADAYMPVTQQFYLQNEFELKTYPVIDVFLNADIKTLNVFLKMSHVNYDLWEPVYFTTPYYPGMRRSFTFGIKWMFFD